MKDIYRIVDIHPNDGYYNDRDALIGNKIILINSSEYKHDGFIGCDFIFLEGYAVDSFYLVKLEKDLNYETVAQRLNTKITKTPINRTAPRSMCFKRRGLG